MRTILYNRTIKKMVNNRIYENGYNSVFPGGILNDDILELQVVDTPKPIYNSVTQTIASEYKISDNQYVQVWTVTDKSPEQVELEAAQKNWPHPDYEFRIRVPKQLGQKYPNIYVHFLLESLPVEKVPDNDNLRDVYINTVLPEHGDILKTEQESVEIHSIPVMLKTFA